GDLNCRLKSLGCNEFNQNGKILENILENPRLLLVNDDTPTFTSKSHEYSSVLDLFIVSTNLGPSINSFFVLDDDLTSDHFPIFLTFDFSIADWEKFKLELTQYSQNVKNIESIDLLNSELTNLIIKASYASIPRLSSKRPTSMYIPAFLEKDK
ncbi:RNA-directed DNA polymerase from mobile element jockey-like, partial [Brachionus plicatilis]